MSPAITSISSLSFGSSPTLAKLPDNKSQANDFTDMLNKVSGNLINNLHESETKTAAAIEGNGSMQQAVIATMTAEQSLQAAIAVRDKIVSAFLEISRMQI